VLAIHTTRGENQQVIRRRRLQISAEPRTWFGAEEFGRRGSRRRIAIAFQTSATCSKASKAMAAERVERAAMPPPTPAVLVPVEDPGYTYLVMPVADRS